MSSELTSPPAHAAPLVTIGIPTYNRPTEVARALRSALAQDHGAIEVVVSDNASPDPAVDRVLSAVAAEDSRVRHLHQPQNIGHAANYQLVLREAKGSYFLWLADDDWLDPAYVRRCLAELTVADPPIVACGVGQYYRDGQRVLTERPLNLMDGRPERRLTRYFARVSLNGPLFGLARRSDWMLTGFPHEIGGDWLLVASLAARGRIRTLGDVHVHRSLGGLGEDPTRLAEGFGMRGFWARYHHLVVAGRMWKKIMAGGPEFPGMSPAGRLWTASAAAGLILARFIVAPLILRGLGQRLGPRLEARISGWLRAADERSAPADETPEGGQPQVR